MVNRTSEGLGDKLNQNQNLSFFDKQKETSAAELQNQGVYVFLQLLSQ